MFSLVGVEDVVRLPPEKFSTVRFQSLEEEVNAKYVNKVLEDEGLCLGLWDWIQKGDDRILHGDGATMTRVKFRLVVFRPEIGEVMLARVSVADPSGLELSLEFFDDIHIAASAIQTPAEFDENEKAWVWKYEGNDLYIYEGDFVWFKVTELKFPSEEENKAYQMKAVNAGEEKPPKRSPMTVHGSIAGEGLGVISWWT